MTLSVSAAAMRKEAVARQSSFSQVTSDKTRRNDSSCAKRGSGWI